MVPALENVLLTAADYKRLTPEYGMGPRYQLVEGELLPMSAPNRFHQEISRNLCSIIDNYLKQHAIGVVYTSPLDDYLDDNNVFQPDLLYVSRERTSVLVPEGVIGAPDLVMEILSPSTAALDRQQKRRVYARTGTAEMWLIDPARRSIEMFDLVRDAEQASAIVRLGEGEVDFGTSLLPGLRLTLADIFATRLG